MVLKGFARGEGMPFLLGEPFSFPEMLRRVLQGWDGKVPEVRQIFTHSTGKKKKKKNPVVPRNPKIS